MLLKLKNEERGGSAVLRLHAESSAAAVKFKTSLAGEDRREEASEVGRQGAHACTLR